MAQIGKGEFDQLRELLGVSEPAFAHEKKTVPSDRASKLGAAMAGVAPWKLVVAGVLALAAIGLVAALMGAFDEPTIVVREGVEEEAGQGAVLSDGGDAAAGRAPATAEGVPDAAAEEPPPTILVHVAGAVLAPGVYELPLEARVNDAVAAAGGLCPDAQPDALNLASPLTDGAKVLVPRVGEEAAPADSAQGEAAASPGVVDINRAGADELQALPGIGPSLAAAIVEEREVGGPFASPEDLMRVSGIGEKKYAKLAGLVTV